MILSLSILKYVGAFKRNYFGFILFIGEGNEVTCVNHPKDCEA